MLNKVHCFDFDNTKIIMDINSGAVHEVDLITWEYVHNFIEANGDVSLVEKKLMNKDFQAQEIKEVGAELADLMKQGLLFSSDSALQGYQVTPQPIVKALCLHVAHDCNLRCQYCFAGTGNFGGERTMLDLHTGKKAIDFILEASGQRKNCEIDFFGGEPLLNFQVVKDLVAYGKEAASKKGKNLKFTLTTNGVLLNDEVTEFLNQHEIAVVLSLDGRQEVNDRMRTFVNGTGSYEVILPKIKNLVESRNNENYFVRGTFTNKNIDFAQDVKHLVDSGFSLVSVEPVVAEGDVDYAFTEADMPKLKEEYEKLTRIFLEYYQSDKAFSFFHFNLDLRKGPCLPKRLSGCGAGHEYLAVSPEGDLYPCHQFVGKEEFKIGSVWSGVENKLIGQQFQHAHVLNKPECMDCWARFLCSGGCHANAIDFTGSLTEPYKIACDLEKKRLECAIYLQVKLAE